MATLQHARRIRALASVDQLADTVRGIGCSTSSHGRIHGDRYPAAMMDMLGRS